MTDDLNYKYDDNYVLNIFYDKATAENYTLSLEDALPVADDGDGADEGDGEDSGVGSDGGVDDGVC